MEGWSVHSASIWHAFNSLQDPGRGDVDKSKLKVLTHNIANCLGLLKVEEKLEDNYETNAITFPSFFAFIKSEVFNKIPPENANYADARNKISEVAWFVCCRAYAQRAPVVLDNNCMFILWKIFNTLADYDSDGMVETPVVMDCEEVVILSQQFCSIIGSNFSVEDLRSICPEITKFSYNQVLSLFETHLCHGDKVEKSLTVDTLNILQDEIISEVIKKGLLTKKGQKIPNWKERWLVLNPTQLVYYAGSDEKEVKGHIPISTQCKTELCPRTRGPRPYRFKLITPGRVCEMSAADMRTRSEWITEIKRAIEHSRLSLTPQQMIRQKRQADREKRWQQEKEEEEKRKQEQEAINEAKQELEAQRLAREVAEARATEEQNKYRQEQEIVNQTRQQLEAMKIAQDEAAEEIRQEQERALKTQEKLAAEKAARAEVELRLIEEAALREVERRRRDELEALQRQLEQLLEEERQAKKDEEIVRMLQAKVLQEEFDKREELEHLQGQLQESLRVEQQRRQGLEELSQQHQQQLKVEQLQLQQLQQERHDIEHDLQDAQLKLQEAENARLEMKEKLAKKQQEKPVLRLAAHLPDDGEFKIVTHRGRGAFVEADFKRSPGLEEYHMPPMWPGLYQDDSGVPSDGSISPAPEKTEFDEKENPDITSTEAQECDDTDTRLEAQSIGADIHSDPNIPLTLKGEGGEEDGIKEKETTEIITDELPGPVETPQVNNTRQSGVVETMCDPSDE